MKNAVISILIILLVLYGATTLYVENQNDKLTIECNELRTTIQEQETKKEMKMEIIEELKEKANDPKTFGYASYYDYTLDNGWSSIGHYVCASRDFPRFTTIKVTNLYNNKSVNCLITDYGPDASVFPERIVDLSSTSFNSISDTKLGVIGVQVTPVND